MKPAARDLRRETTRRCETTRRRETTERAFWWTILVAAMTLPTAAALTYFVWLEGTAWVAPVYLAAKAAQFSGPLLLLGALLAAAHGPSNRRRDVALGLATGIAGAAMTWIAWVALFRGGEMANHAAAAVRTKLADFGLDHVQGFIVAALVISFLHSWLEEVYWRAFVHRRLEMLMAPVLALPLGAGGFAAHHVVVIGAYVGDVSVLVLALMTLPVVGGGVLWSLLYRHTGNRLLAPWISHVLLDLAIMAVGYDLLFSAPAP